MSRALKIAIVGDYNFTFNSHHATNLSIDHSADFLEYDVNYYWLKVNEAVKYKPIYFEQFDGIWIAPGPYENIFFLNGVFRLFIDNKIPVLITGDSYRLFLEYLINLYQLNPYSEKLISENLVEGNQFERITIYPKSIQFKALYENFNNVELTSSRFSLYPSLISKIEPNIVDIEAFNQFEDPEIISLSKHPFFVACSFCPQISSTRDIPHPIIYTFLKVAYQRNKES